MNQRPRIRITACNAVSLLTSRRVAVGAAAAGFLGLLTGTAFGREQPDAETLKAEASMAAAQKKADEEAYQRLLRRRPEMRAFYEGVGPNATMEERMAAVQRYTYQQDANRFKGAFGVSDEEWEAIQPRFEKVYFLSTPPAYFPPEDTSASAMVSRFAKELGALVNNKDAKPDEIKVKLDALRGAQQQVRQELAHARRELRKVLTVRQEAMLLLNGLLD